MRKNGTMRRSALRAAAAAALLAAGLGACTPGRNYSPTDNVSLPPDAVQGAGDPTRAAILNSAYAFGTPQSLAGRPAEAAVAAAQLDYLASEITYGPRWREFDPTVGLLLQKARGEVRNYLGVSQEAAPQVVIDSLYGASRALRSNDRTAALRIMAPPVYPNAEGTLGRLAALPLLPTANQATTRAAQELDRMDRIGGQSRGGGGIGGGRN